MYNLRDRSKITHLLVIIIEQKSINPFYLSTYVNIYCIKCSQIAVSMFSKNTKINKPKKSFTVKSMTSINILIIG